MPNKMLIDATHPEEGRDPRGRSAWQPRRGIRLRLVSLPTVSNFLRNIYLCQGDAGRALAAGRLRRFRRQPPRLSPSAKFIPIIIRSWSPTGRRRSTRKSVQRAVRRRGGGGHLRRTPLPSGATLQADRATRYQERPHRRSFRGGRGRGCRHGGGGFRDDGTGGCRRCRRAACGRGGTDRIGCGDHGAVRLLARQLAGGAAQRLERAADVGRTATSSSTLRSVST